MKKSLFSLILFFHFAAISIMAKSDEFNYIPESGMNKLLLEIQKLPVVGNVMYVGAHPDDENNSVMVYLNKGLHYNTSYLVSNWGEGGQNEIGNELYDALGVIRSQELQSARAIDGGKQLYLGVYDFGYSISSAETLGIWGYDETLGKLVRIIRMERPDVIMTNHDTKTGHGHHQAIGILLLAAFEKAADPNAYPKQITEEGLLPWQVKKLYVATDKNDGNCLAINSGEYSNILGRSYSEIGAISRSSHRCQGMQCIGQKGDDISYYTLEKTVVGHGNTSVMDGIETDLKAYIKLIKAHNPEVISYIDGKLGELMAISGKIVSGFKTDEVAGTSKLVADSINLLKDLISYVGKSNLPDSDKNYVITGLKSKEKDFVQAYTDMYAVDLDVVSDDFDIYPGQTVKVTATLWNRGGDSIKNVKISLDFPKALKTDKPVIPFDVIQPHSSATAVFEVTVPEDFTTYTGPYDLSPISAVAEWSTADTTINTKENAEVRIVPAVALTISPEKAMIVASGKEKIQTVSVVLKNNFKSAIKGEVKLTVPDGWEIITKDTSFSISEENKDTSVQIDVGIPPGASAGNYKIKASAIVNGKEFTNGYQVISYPHINTEYFYKNPVTEIVIINVKTADVKVGYIDSGFDHIPDYLKMIGVRVNIITPEELATGNLSVYDTIITGIRIYRSRTDVAANNDRLLEYVKNGGNLVVQFCKTIEWGKGFSPYEIVLSSDNVNDENAPVTVLDPKSPILNKPNVITEADWKGWFQQRAEWTPESWSDKYKTVISTHDPEQSPRDSLILVADYGKGTYVYTSAVWHLEMDKLIPGAYRIFANIISLPKEK